MYNHPINNFQDESYYMQGDGILGDLASSNLGSILGPLLTKLAIEKVADKLNVPETVKSGISRVVDEGLTPETISPILENVTSNLTKRGVKALRQTPQVRSMISPEENEIIEDEIEKVRKQILTKLVGKGVVSKSKNKKMIIDFL